MRIIRFVVEMKDFDNERNFKKSNKVFCWKYNILKMFVILNYYFEYFSLYVLIKKIGDIKWW